jgi:hypothetical protein
MPWSFSRASVPVDLFLVSDQFQAHTYEGCIASHHSLRNFGTSPFARCLWFCRPSSSSICHRSGNLSDLSPMVAACCMLCLSFILAILACCCSLIAMSHLESIACSSEKGKDDEEHCQVQETSQRKGEPLLTCLSWCEDKVRRRSWHRIHRRRSSESEMGTTSNKTRLSRQYHHSSSWQQRCLAWQTMRPRRPATAHRRRQYHRRQRRRELYQVISPFQLRSYMHTGDMPVPRSRLDRLDFYDLVAGNWSWSIFDSLTCASWFLF